MIALDHLTPQCRQPSAIIRLGHFPQPVGQLEGLESAILNLLAVLIVDLWFQCMAANEYLRTTSADQELAGEAKSTSKLSWPSISLH